MKKIVLAILLGLIGTWAWGATGYSYNYTAGMMNIQSYCYSQTNCWHPLNSGSVYDTDEGGDGQVVATNGSGDIFTWNYTTRTWNINNEGGSWTNVAVQDQFHVYLLGAAGASGCPSPNKPIYFWDGSHLPSLISGCLTTIYINKYGSQQLVEGINSLGQAWYTEDGGSIWSQDSSLTNMTYLFIDDIGDRCSVKNGVLSAYQASIDSNWVTFSPAPSGTIAGCIFNANGFAGGSDTSTHNFMLVWTTSGTVMMYDPLAGTWSTIYGSSATKVVGPGKSNIIEMSGGLPYHYNVVTSTVTLTGSGSFNGCPTPAQPCNAGIKHRITAHVYHAHELQGNIGMQEGAPNVVITASSTAVSAKCDPFFGAPGDGECTVNVDPGQNNEAFCEQSGEAIAQAPGVPQWGGSVDAKSYNGNIVSYLQTPVGPGGVITRVICGATVNSCKEGTYSTCPVVTVDVDAWCGGTSCVEFTELADAEAKCELGTQPAAWSNITPYLKGVPNSCIYGAGADPVLVPEAAFQIPCD